ncbi:hypothetical protein SNE40_019018 [Patella caerulea]|uniref:Fibronectin type III-like domain-containing protein n=1 Tax=Patella caerulea TaxID=87958 RepID=A0AAN8J627_PATCE
MAQWHIFAILLFCFIASISGNSKSNAELPFMDYTLPWEERVDDLVKRLTSEEIMYQLAFAGHVPFGPAPAISRLGIKPYTWDTECERGDVGAGPATSFPENIGLGASFSRSLNYRIAEATALEVRAKYNDYIQHGSYQDHQGLSCYMGTSNIMRDSRWGRNQETNGEDPYLTGSIGSAFVQGLQGNDKNLRYIRTSACPKHLAVYSGPEDIPYFRYNFTVSPTQRDLHTSYLPMFRQMVQAGAYSIMCTYTSLYGVPTCVNKFLLTDILRDEWNFKGFVVSDSGALLGVLNAHFYVPTKEDVAAVGINAGCNQELASPNQDKPPYLYIMDAVNAGKINESLLRERVWPLFYTRMRLGEFDPPEMNPYRNLNISIIQSSAQRDLSLEAAMKTFVLLKNNGLLPLKQNKYDKIAVVGPFANTTGTLYGNYAPDMNLAFTYSVLAGVKELASQSNFAAGCSDTVCDHYNGTEIQQAVTGVDMVFIAMGTGVAIEVEGHDRTSLELPNYQPQLIKDVVSAAGSASIVLLLFNGGPVNITWADENDAIDAIMECWFPAQETGIAIKKVLLNDGAGSVPAARLPYTWLTSADQLPPMADYSMKGRTYRYYEGESLYPFGYGLSYTTFNYKHMEYSSEVLAGINVQGTVIIENTGDYDADEVVQVYISWINATQETPNIQLVDFDRIFIRSHSTMSYDFTISPENMAVWVDDKGWIVESGNVNLWVGGQQPNQKKQIPSNILQGSFSVVGSKFLGFY